MREALAMLEGQRITVRGLFAKTGRKANFGKRENQHGRTILFRPLIHPDGGLLTDHLWMNYCASFDALSLTKNTVVEFTAKVSPYSRGAGSSIDYSLTYPTKVRIVQVPVMDLLPEPDFLTLLTPHVQSLDTCTQGAVRHLQLALRSLTDGTGAADLYTQLLLLRNTLYTLSGTTRGLEGVLASMKLAASPTAPQTAQEAPTPSETHAGVLL